MLPNVRQHGKRSPPAVIDGWTEGSFFRMNGGGTHRCRADDLDLLAVGDGSTSRTMALLRLPAAEDRSAR